MIFIASILIRTAIIYILLNFAMRIMGKRQIGELDVSELVSTLLISELVSIPIDDPDIPLMTAVISVMFILSVEIILSTIKNKSEKMKEKIEGEPVYIIYKGRLLQKALSENRISINELLSEMRVQGISDIDDIYYAILEQNGSLSLIKKDADELAHPIIIDTEVDTKTLAKCGYNEKWLEARLREHRAKKEEIFLMTVTDRGETKIILKDSEK